MEHGADLLSVKQFADMKEEYVELIGLAAPKQQQGKKYFSP